jgi:hypothetical protein
MQYFKDRWLKIIFIAFPLLLIIVIFLSPSTHNKKSESENPQPDITLKDKPEGHYDNFRVNKISIVKKEDNRILFSLSADMIIHRKRISKLFVYQNLKEICMSGVMIDIYPYNMRSVNRHKNIAIPIDDIGSSFTSLGKPSTPIEEYLAGNADIDLDLLTRLLLENLSINIHLPDNKKIVLAAKSARINVDLENIVLEGPVKVITSDGKELYASEAVWSKKFNGIYLPDGYALQNEQHKGKAFFAINTKGEFLKVWKCPNIKYIDPLEEREKAFYANLSKKMPASARFMFGMGMPQK